MSVSEDFHARCNTARAKFAPHCSEPCPTDQYRKVRWVMSGAHLMFVEMLENVYLRAETISPAEEQDFAYFAWIGITLIEQHHRMEETITFPMMEPEFKTDVLNEHAAFSKGLHDLDEYLKSVMAVTNGKLYGQVVPVPGQARVPYDGAKLKRTLESFTVPLFTHLSHEIDWLAPENIRASGVTNKTLAAISEAEERHIKGEIDPTTCIVMVMGHLPAYCQFPDMPWFVKKAIIPWVLYWRHRALWKYLPSWTPEGKAIINIKS